MRPPLPGFRLVPGLDRWVTKELLVVGIPNTFILGVLPCLGRKDSFVLSPGPSGAAVFGSGLSGSIAMVGVSSFCVEVSYNSAIREQSWELV